MKGFEKFILIVFSLLVVVLSVGVILSATEMINSTILISNFMNIIVSNKIPTLVICAILVVFALIGIFSSSDDSDDMKTGLAIKTEKGTVYITKDTFESIIVSIAKNYPELRNIKVDIKVNETGVIANVYAMILPDTVVTTLTAKLQDSIKTNVLNQTTVEIKEANIKIKGVYTEPQKNK